LDVEDRTAFLDAAKRPYPMRRHLADQPDVYVAFLRAMAKETSTD
jgi:hypothetical protein